MNHTNKAQIEIMGLVVVVVLVVIGLFFSLALRPTPADKTPSAIYEDQKMASDYLITFLETNAQGCNLPLKDLAIDCVRGNTTGVYRYTCQGTNSCDYVNKTLHNITFRTLDEWGLSYTIHFFHRLGETDTTLALVDHTDCTDNRPRSAPGIQPVPIYGVAPGNAVFRMDICN